MPRWRSLALLSGMLSVLGGCAGQRQAGPAAVGPEAEAIYIEVENQSSTDLTIYLIVDNVSQRLGMVSTNGVLSLEKAWRQIGRGRRLRLRAEVIGSATRVVTEDLRVQPGQLIRWTLASDLKMSTWAIY